MPIDPVSSVAPAAAAPRAPLQTMGSEVFMSLLVAQLRNQDPSTPMNTNEMIAQTTQLAMMESLAGLTRMTEEGFGLQMRVAATSTIGATVSYRDESGAEREGVATAVSFRGPVPTITVNGAAIPLDAIDGIQRRESAAP